MQRSHTTALSLTTPDLILLSLLAESPWHGYAANAELERRQVRDWAGISRPQVYYSLQKLARAGLIRASGKREAATGPERTRYATTARGRAALAEALGREEWARGREHPAFLTWMALSWQAHPGVVREQLRRRVAFLIEELEREEETLMAVRAEVGHDHHEAVWMLQLTIAGFRTELAWLERVERELPERAAAGRHAIG